MRGEKELTLILHDFAELFCTIKWGKVHTDNANTFWMQNESGQLDKLPSRVVMVNRPDKNIIINMNSEL